MKNLPQNTELRLIVLCYDHQRTFDHLNLKYLYFVGILQVLRFELLKSRVQDFSNLHSYKKHEYPIYFNKSTLHFFMRMRWSNASSQDIEILVESSFECL